MINQDDIIVHSEEQNNESRYQDSVNSNDPHLAFLKNRKETLTKQLEIEMKIKNGAENMLQTFSIGPKIDKKLSEDANSMLKDAKLKIQYIKMQLNKLNNFLNEDNTISYYGSHNRIAEELCKFYHTIFLGCGFLTFKIKRTLPHKDTYLAPCVTPRYPQIFIVGIFITIYLQ
jgi:hypothetical protein